MRFNLIKIGNSRGVLIPKGFIDHYADGDSIELDFALMSSAHRKAVSGAEPIEPPENAAEIIANAEVVRVSRRAVKPFLRKTGCKKHHGSYSCGCVDKTV